MTMTERPELNPLAAKLLGGTEGLERLRTRLLAAAASADDPAYAARLRDIADGRRPLRSLLHDPSWRHAMGMDAPGAEEALDAAVADSTDPKAGRPDPAQVAADLRNRLGLAGTPSIEELVAVYPDAVRIQARATAALAEDVSSGWQGSLQYLADHPDAPVATPSAPPPEPPAGPTQTPRRGRPDWDRWGRG
jgi:hypothetical protein